jgi:transcriptional regulator with XRE-family HTH domain
MQSELMVAVAAVIKSLRTQNHWTLEELADRADLHRTTLGLVERGERGLTLGSADSIANAFGIPLSVFVAVAEARHAGTTVRTPARSVTRTVPTEALFDDGQLLQLCGIQVEVVKLAIHYTYETFDIIDNELATRGSEPMAGLVELANLSSMIGNLMGAGLARFSGGLYVRNRPHAFPDLIPQRENLPDLELKTALEKNSPKGHLAKAGAYITFRYVLGDRDGSYRRGKESRGKTIWIWEVRAGMLTESDFSLSNTPGDSGKTAVIKTQSLKDMALILQDERFNPYMRPWG